MPEPGRRTGGPRSGQHESPRVRAPVLRRGLSRGLAGYGLFRPSGVENVQACEPAIVLVPRGEHESVLGGERLGSLLLPARSVPQEPAGRLCIGRPTRARRRRLAQRAEDRPGHVVTSRFPAFSRVFVNFSARRCRRSLQVQFRAHQERRRARARTARQPAQSHGGKDDVALMGQRLKRPQRHGSVRPDASTTTQGARMSTRPRPTLRGAARRGRPPDRRRLPRALRPPAHRRLVPALPPPRDPRGRHGPREDPAGDRRRPRGGAEGPVPRHLPRRGEAELAARDRPGRGRGRRAGAAREGRVRPEDALDRRELRHPRPLRRSLRAASKWGGVIVDEAHFIKNGSRRAAQVLRTRRLAGGRRIPQPSTSSPARR